MAISCIIEVGNDREFKKLKTVALKHGWLLKPAIKTPYIPATSDPEKINKFKQLLEKGMDVSDFGDPLVWQCETRKDRPLPFHE